MFSTTYGRGNQWKSARFSHSQPSYFEPPASRRSPIPIVHGGSDVSMPRGLLLNYKRGPRASSHAIGMCGATGAESPQSCRFRCPLVRMPHYIVRPGADELARQNPILVRRKLSGLSPQLEARSESPIQRADSALTDGSSLYPRFEKQSSVLPSTCNHMVARGSNLTITSISICANGDGLCSGLSNGRLLGPNGAGTLLVATMRAGASNGLEPCRSRTLL